jgi:hypothetical protein
LLFPACLPTFLLACLSAFLPACLPFYLPACLFLCQLHMQMNQIIFISTFLLSFSFPFFLFLSFLPFHLFASLPACLGPWLPGDRVPLVPCSCQTLRPTMMWGNRKQYKINCKKLYSFFASWDMLVYATWKSEFQKCKTIQYNTNPRLLQGSTSNLNESIHSHGMPKR